MTDRSEPLPLPDAERGLLPARVTCRRCGKSLHDPESRTLRLGPACRHDTKRTPRHQVEQDHLPGL